MKTNYIHFFSFLIDRNIIPLLLPWCTQSSSIPIVLLLRQKQNLNMEHCPSFPLIFLIRKKNYYFFWRNTNMVMMTAYVLQATLKKQNKTTKINQSTKTPQKPKNKTNPQKTHKKQTHKPHTENKQFTPAKQHTQERKRSLCCRNQFFARITYF